MSSQRAPNGLPRKLYKDTRKCAWCARGIYDGATLSQCKGCLADVYCGKDCQKLHWPLHKIKCKNDSESLKELAKCPGDVREFAALRRWTHLHRPALMFLAAQELNIYEHPSKTADTALKLVVHLLPQETKEQSRFRIVFVMPVAIADFASAHDIRCAYETTHVMDIQRKNSTVTFVTVVMVEDSTLPKFIIPMSIQLPIIPAEYIPPERVIGIINHGQVAGVLD